MDNVKKPETAEGCEQLAENCEARGNAALAREARRWAIERRAEKYGATTEVELEAVKAVFAYERSLRTKHGKKVSASYTWRMIREQGIIAAMEQLVTKKAESKGYRALVAMGLQDLSFEAVVSRHPDAFSPAAVEASRQRLEEWGFDPEGGGA
jgi:hypothetical protein